eukprot:243273-Pelagomonas_calceolata.AAC.1
MEKGNKTSYKILRALFPRWHVCCGSGPDPKLAACPAQHQRYNKCERGLSENMPKYAPFLHLKCARPQPFDPIGTMFALKCSWRYKLPEHML